MVKRYLRHLPQFPRPSLIALGVPHGGATRRGVPHVGACHTAVWPDSPLSPARLNTPLDEMISKPQSTLRLLPEQLRGRQALARCYRQTKGVALVLAMRLRHSRPKM